ncbi:intraflagellar transport protein 172 [Acrasis kona]
MRRQQWEEGEILDVPQLYSITSAAWKPDGSRLVLGNMCGGVDMFDACIKRYRYKGEFEFTFVSPSQVIVKRIQSGTRIVLKSLFEEEILKVNVARDQFLVGHTPKTLLLGDLESCKLSEIPWNGSGEEKFFFDNPRVCMVFNAGEISLIEYGINDIIGSFRTEHVSTHLISARISDISPFLQKEAMKDPNLQVMSHDKKVAFLIDSHTINILDLMSSFPIAKINHDAKIDWLELNVRATKLLFRDKQRHLHLFDIKTQTRTTLLTYCSYVQWVPDSDVVVAQNRGDLCVWYSIDAPDRVTIVPIKGEVQDITRASNCTTVVVDEGPGTVNYDLDEGLIEFGNSMEEKNYEHAADILEQLSLTPETEAMWKNLSELVLHDNKFHIAERCYAALGDVSKANYLRKIVKEIRDIVANEEEQGLVDPLDHWRVRSKVSMLNKDFRSAEQAFLEQGKVTEAMNMYKEVHKFDESIGLAIAKGVPNANEMKNKYMQWLIDSRQEDKAARMYEKEGQYSKAIQLYLSGGFPALAANVIVKGDASVLPTIQDKLLEQISNELSKNQLYEKAGEFYEKRKLNEKAIESYRRGNAYRYAVELSRNVMPDLVIKLEEEWGDWLVSQKQIESAVVHFIEANQYVKAIEAALTSRQWAKAIQILDGVEPATSKKYYARVARHYEDIQNYSQAKKFYIKGGKYMDAIEMFEKIGSWDQVYEIAESYLSEAEISQLYTTQAGHLENKTKFKEAEKLYIKANEPDLAINMYSKNHLFDDMIRLVSLYRNTHLKDAHIQIAQQLEKEGHFKQAEYHFLQVDDWKNAVDMYRNGDKWNDAIRVAQKYGGPGPYKKVAWEWASYIKGEAGAKLLYKLGFVEEAIEYCINRELWDKAMEMARSSNKVNVSSIHLKYAMFLEDQAHFKEAEEEYIQGKSPKEAVEMYLHQNDWANAMRVADSFDSTMINRVLECQAESAWNNGQHDEAERLFTQASRQDRIIQKYMEARKFEDAKRVASTYSNDDVKRKINTEWAESIEHDGDGDPCAPARMFQQSGEFSKAIDTYLNFDWRTHLQNRTTTAEYCEAAWMDAFKIATNHLQARLSEVVHKVTTRLLEINKVQKAVEVFLSIGMYKEACEELIKNGLWGEAISAARQSNQQDLINHVQSRHKKFLTNSHNPDEQIQGGNIVGAIDAFAQRKEWDECLRLAKDSNRSDQVNKYTAIYITQLHRENRHREALEVLENYGPSVDPQLPPVYKGIIRNILWTQPTPQESLRCRSVLNAILAAYRKVNMAETNLVHLSRFQEACHLIVMRDELAAAKNVPAINTLHAKCNIALLRYCNILPPDAAFYEAGMACREQGIGNKDQQWETMSFSFLNRYLDVIDAMEQLKQDGAEEDIRNRITLGKAELVNTEFQYTDIPFKVPVPVQQYLDSKKNDEVTNIVLYEGVNNNIQGELQTRKCDKCFENIYVANMVCPNEKCNHQYKQCCVTGYPVTADEKVECTKCHAPSNRNDWNHYISKFKNCPVCGDLQLTIL